MKTCLRCNRELPVDNFYRHSQTSDRRLNKCKVCTRSDVRSNRLAKIDYYRKMERERRREHRKVYKRPVQERAYNAVARAVRSGKLQPTLCEKCGKKAEAHHPDYAKPLDVRWLCKIHHEAEHHG